jgi:hypothetical protein
MTRAIAILPPYLVVVHYFIGDEAVVSNLDNTDWRMIDHADLEGGWKEEVPALEWGHEDRIKPEQYKMNGVY